MYFLTGKLSYNGQTSSLETVKKIDKRQILPRSTLIPDSTFSISFDLPDLNYNVGRDRVLVSVLECGDVSSACVRACMRACVRVCVCVCVCVCVHQFL